jgi:hypothetical protein
MFPPRIIRSIVACTLACGLLATMTSAAAAECPPNLPDGATTSCLPGKTQDLRSPDARDAADAERITRMMDHYYATYSEPKPAPAPAVADNDSPFLLISVIAGALALVLAGTTLVVRRRHTPAV